MAGSILSKTGNDFQNETFLGGESGLYFDSASSQYLDTFRTSDYFGISTSSDTFSFSVVINMTSLTDSGNGIAGSLFSTINSALSTGIGIRLFVRKLTSSTYNIEFQMRGTNLKSVLIETSQLLNINTVYHIVATKDSGTTWTNFKIYVNTIEDTILVVDQVIGAGTNVLSESIRFGVEFDGSNADNFIDGYLSHIAIFNKALTQHEISRIHTHLGYIPQDLRTDSGLVYWLPLQEQYARKLVSGDSALTKNASLSIGDNVLFSVEEICNPDKTTALTGTHAKLINFNDDEVGTAVRNPQTAFRSLYNSDVRYSPVGKKYESASSMYDTIVGFTFSSNQASTFILQLSNSQSSTMIFSSNNVGSGSSHSIEIFTGTDHFRFRIIDNTNTNEVNVKGLFPVNYDNSKTGQLIICYDGLEDVSGIDFFYDGVQLTKETVYNQSITTFTTAIDFMINRRPFASIPVYNDLYFYNLEILDTDKSGDTAFIEHVSKWGSAYNYVANSEFLLAVDFNKKDTALDTLNSTPSYTINQFNGDLKTSAMYREKKTLMPPMHECLKMVDTDYVEYDTTNLPTNTDDFTIFVSGYMNDPNPFNGAKIAEQEYLLGIFDKNTGVNYGAATNAIRLRFSKRDLSTTYNTYLINQYKSAGFSSVAYSTTKGSLPQDYYFVNLAVSYKSGLISQYINGLKVNEGNTTSFNMSTMVTKLFRTGFLNYDDANTISNITEMYLSSMYMWKGRALDGWEHLELYKQSQLSNPFNWLNSQGTGFQDNLTHAHVFNNGQIYDDGSNWRVENFGSGADATLGGYTRTTSDFSADNAGAIVDINSLR